MKRFKFKDERFRKVIIVILILLILYIYFNIIGNTSFYKYIMNNINSKYELNVDFNNKILYTSLNKIVSPNTMNIKRVENVAKIEEVKKEEKNITSKPIIYIYNTHESESYSSPFTSDYTIRPTVQLASLILKDYLNDFGVESFVQKKSIKKYLNKYNLDYTGSYRASRAYMNEEIKKNDYKIFIDLHRDSAKHKYTLFKNGDKKYAKIMFVLATDYKTYKDNEKFVKNLNNRLNKKYNGITRGILKRSDASFNQEVSPRAILVELGGVDNTLEEINNTLYVLAQVLSEYISEELYD